MGAIARDLHNVPLADLAAAAASLTPSQRGAPTTEVGVPGNVYVGLGPQGIPGWGYFVDDREYAPELQWPQSTEAYERMETDAQLKGLLLATTLPIRRFQWEFDPNGADPGIVEHLAEDFSLPVRGEDPRPRRRGGFNHDRHMGHALRALSQGHYHFEIVVELRDDGLLHLSKLGTRPPRSIVGIRTDEHGELQAIEQLTTGIGGDGPRIGGVPTFGTRILEASRLLTYLWDTADDGDQVGRSMLRSCYRDWLVKDALIRVDAVKHERNGMGVPWFETDPKASQKQIDQLAIRAEEVRAGAVGGGAGPGKLGIKGVDGSIPDTIGSIRYHDEQMSKAFMLLFFNLGGDTKFGSRALGNSFMDWYTSQQGAIADWYCEQTQRLVDQIVAWNWGPDEQAPLIAYTRMETEEVAFADLAIAVEKGLVAVDPELRAYIGERFKIPGQADYVPPAAPTPPPTEEEPQVPAVAATERAQPKRSALAEAMLGHLRTKGPTTWPQLAAAVGSDRRNGTARRARDLLMAENALCKSPDGQRIELGTNSAPSLPKGAKRSLTLSGVTLSLPARDLKRQPNAAEVASRVDLATMEETYLTQRASLVDAYKEAQAAQIEQLAAEVEAADGSAPALASLTVDPVDDDLLYEHLIATAEAGVAAARQEHEDQLAGAAPAAASLATADVTIDTVALQQTVRERAEAAALTLANGLATAASKKAAAVSALAPDEAATTVRDYLSSLSDAALDEQLGGATHQAYNSGRRAYMAEAGPKEIWASEILDQNVCANCNAIDGTEWQTLAEAEVAYPVGGYVECEGGLRCRGTLVAVY